MDKHSNISKILISTAAITAFGLLLFYKNYQNNNSLTLKEQAMLKMDFWEFDQSDQGWRSLDVINAAALIDIYIKSCAKLQPYDKASLYFHAGQIYAEVGDYKTAIERFQLSKHQPNSWVEKGWNAYVDATIAFLKNDRDTLLSAQQILEKYKNAQLKDTKGKFFYPHRVNVRIVEQLLQGLRLELTYSQAYRGIKPGPLAKCS